jgi:hypothetical protein
MQSGRHEWACFAAHQAVEKALKGLNLALGQQAWTPDPPADLEDRLRMLDGFYIPTRYPDSYPEGTPGEHFGRLQSEQALLHGGTIRGRGDAGVGSDLDLVLILEACDLLVYDLREWQTLPQWNPRLANALGHETRWLAGQP